MVLTILGRRSDDPSSKECCYIWELLAVALNDMVAEVRIPFLHGSQRVSFFGLFFIFSAVNLFVFFFFNFLKTYC